MGCCPVLSVTGLKVADGQVVLLTLSAFMLLTTLVWLLHHVLLHFGLNRMPVLTAAMAAPHRTTPKVSVIIPARAEEPNQRPCLHTLISQDYPDLEIIVIDDRSTDRTASVAEEFARRAPHLTLVRNTELPEGWTGKNYAIHLAREHAHGHYLIFLDADTWYHPRAISQIVSFAQSEHIDMLSLIAGYHLGTFWEKALQPIILALMGFCLKIWKVNQHTSSTAFAAGQFILMTRSAYQLVGGHQTVRGCLVEDVALARVAKRAGLNLKIAFAPDLLKIRMYKGLRQISTGWTRIFQGCMHQDLSRILRGTVEIIVFALLPWLGLLTGLLGLFLGRHPSGFIMLTAASGLATAAQVSVLLRMFPFCRTSRWYVLMLGPAILFILFFWTMALFRLCTGSTAPWRGTRYRPERERDKASGTFLPGLPPSTSDNMRSRT